MENLVLFFTALLCFVSELKFSFSWETLVSTWRKEGKLGKKKEMPPLSAALYNFFLMVKSNYLVKETFLRVHQIPCTQLWHPCVSCKMKFYKCMSRLVHVQA